MVKKEKWFENPMTWVGVVVLVIVVWMAWPSASGDYDAFASCLTDSGAVMYGTEWCGHCKAQKEMFGSSFENVNYVDCDRLGDSCLIAGVTGYPTWVIDGEKYPGQQPLSELADLSRCELVKDFE